MPTPRVMVGGGGGRGGIPGKVRVMPATAGAAEPGVVVAPLGVAAVTAATCCVPDVVAGVLTAGAEGSVSEICTVEGSVPGNDGEPKI